MTKYERTQAYISILLIFCIILVLFAYQISRPSGKLEVTFLDIGQGDSIYIKSPIGTEMLIDAGPDKTVLQRLGRQMAPFDRSIDVLLATHPDKDHIGGIPSVLSKYSVGLFIESGAENKNGVYDEVNKRIVKKDVARVQAFKGQKIDLGAGVIFTILYPNQEVEGLDTNDASIVGLLTYGEHSLLLTGDAGYMVEARIIKDLSQDITVLKVGHHGSDSSTGFELLEKTTPEIAILSVGKNNSYGHPHRKVTDLLSQFKVSYYRTDESGSITMLSDGESYEIKTAR
jgi:competence protein ComEC